MAASRLRAWAAAYRAVPFYPCPRKRRACATGCILQGAPHRLRVRLCIAAPQAMSHKGGCQRQCPTDADEVGNALIVLATRCRHNCTAAVGEAMSQSCVLKPVKHCCGPPLLTRQAMCRMGMQYAGRSRAAPPPFVGRISQAVPSGKISLSYV